MEDEKEKDEEEEEESNLEVGSVVVEYLAPRAAVLEHYHGLAARQLADVEILGGRRGR